MGVSLLAGAVCTRRFGHGFGDAFKAHKKAGMLYHRSQYASTFATFSENRRVWYNCAQQLGPAYPLLPLLLKGYHA
jgi:hypothetical protein